ncbi:901_t:CDS:1 [Cetraspora pellucida]|uniref:901_t:CDS:1 n=1 Tax=Cetraspora pellucida TaxID=1433469 RepID=A0ACA9N3P5_9GLOM|nr:901_t:CDS:1 [Cetraspora pellucida]
MYMVNPNKGEKYYLRLLLNYVKGATSFIDLKKIGNYMCTTFRESVLMHRIIEIENLYYNAMQEATFFKMPYALRQLFAIILVFGELENVQILWDNNFVAMSEDFANKGITNKQLLTNSVLLQIKIILEQHHRKLSKYNLPQLELPDNQIQKIY